MATEGAEHADLDAAFPAAAFVRNSVVWDAVYPYWPEVNNTLDKLEHFRAAGYTGVSVDVAGDFHDIGQAIQLLACCRRYLLERPDAYVLVQRADDIPGAQAEGKLAIVFQLEGSRCFERNLDMVEVFHRLGVRHSQLVFNVPNGAAGGCAEGNELPLTSLGRALVQEMQRVGMVLDLAHTGYRSTMDAMALSDQPVIFSHCNAFSVYEHYRNLRDDQIRSCAETGGVIGLSGASGYLGDRDSASETILRHMDHIAGLVGTNHIGLGFDACFDEDAVNRWILTRPEAEWPGSRDGDWPGFHYAKPAQLPELVALMAKSGYGSEDIRKVLGENYLRVFKTVWK